MSTANHSVSFSPFQTNSEKEVDFKTPEFNAVNLVSFDRAQSMNRIGNPHSLMGTHKRTRESISPTIGREDHRARQSTERPLCRFSHTRQYDTDSASASGDSTDTAGVARGLRLPSREGALRFPQPRSCDHRLASGELSEPLVNDQQYRRAQKGRNTSVGFPNDGRDRLIIVNNSGPERAIRKPKQSPE